MKDKKKPDISVVKECNYGIALNTDAEGTMMTDMEMLVGGELRSNRIKKVLLNQIRQVYRAAGIMTGQRCKYLAKVCPTTRTMFYAIPAPQICDTVNDILAHIAVSNIAIMRAFMNESYMLPGIFKIYNHSAIVDGVTTEFTSMSGLRTILKEYIELDPVKEFYKLYGSESNDSTIIRKLNKILPDFRISNRNTPMKKLLHQNLKRCCYYILTSEADPTDPHTFAIHTPRDHKSVEDEKSVDDSLRGCGEFLQGFGYGGNYVHRICMHSVNENDNFMQDSCAIQSCPFVNDLNIKYPEDEALHRIKPTAVDNGWYTAMYQYYQGNHTFTVYGEPYPSGDHMTVISDETCISMEDAVTDIAVNTVTGILVSRLPSVLDVMIDNGWVLWDEYLLPDMKSFVGMAVHDARYKLSGTLFAKHKVDAIFKEALEPYLHICGDVVEYRSMQVEVLWKNALVCADLAGQCYVTQIAPSVTADQSKLMDFYKSVVDLSNEVAQISDVVKRRKMQQQLTRNIKSVGLTHALYDPVWDGCSFQLLPPKAIMHDDLVDGTFLLPFAFGFTNLDKKSVECAQKALNKIRKKL